ncbi:MAG: VOC family protein [Alphaproteobacteria bacterium]|nr:VOC family protein [Alphaproteobacteria bacterium]MCZ6610323.1 VOC family protein [Alphaproteobacteria bacterium]
MGIIDGFSHLVIHVTDLDRSEAFYRDVIGLDVIGRDLVNDQGPNLLLAMNSRQRVLLVEVPEVVAIRPNSSTIHHAWLLTMEEFDRTRARLKKMGYEVSDSRAQFRAMGEHSMDLFDPDGHRYQIQAYAPEATAVLCDNTGPINCGHLDDFPVGTVKSFVKGKFFLVRLDDGFIALSRWCTHLNGLLSWKKEHWEFYCPMHGARFDRRGMPRPLSHTPIPLRVHPVTITPDGEVMVDPDTAISRDGFSADHVVAPEPGAHLATEAREGA